MWQIGIWLSWNFFCEFSKLKRVDCASIFHSFFVFLTPKKKKKSKIYILHLIPSWITWVCILVLSFLPPSLKALNFRYVEGMGVVGFLILMGTKKGNNFSYTFFFMIFDCYWRKSRLLFINFSLESFMVYCPLSIVFSSDVGAFSLNLLLV